MNMKLKKIKMKKTNLMEILKKNKKGTGVTMYIVFGLIAIIGILGYAVLNQSGMKMILESATSFWNSIKWWVLGIGIFLFLWLSGAFKLLRKLLKV